MLDKIIETYNKNVASMDLVKKLMQQASTATHLSRADKLAQIQRHQQVLTDLEGKHKAITEMYQKYTQGTNVAHGGINGLKMANEAKTKAGE